MVSYPIYVSRQTYRGRDARKLAKAADALLPQGLVGEAENKER
jgi:hypothetical protein